LSGNDNINIEAHYVASNIPIFLKIAEFHCSVNKYQSPLMVRERFLDREEAENIKY